MKFPLLTIKYSRTESINFTYLQSCHSNMTSYGSFIMSALPNMAVFIKNHKHMHLNVIDAVLRYTTVE